MDKLIVQPLREIGISTVIIVDALDECKDEEPASAILSVLGQFVSEIPKAKFLITGRPEPRIREGFRLSLSADATDVFVLHDVEPNQVDDDIRLFFRRKFLEIVLHRRGLDGWPTKEQLDLLCKRAAGLFVYAVATVKFIGKQSANPMERLDLLLRSPHEGSEREARTKFNGNTTLDSLYASVLQGAFGDDDDPDSDPKVRSVLGTMTLAANPISSSSIAMLMGLDADRDVFPLLSSAQSLLILQEDINCPVRPFHKSFPDFITDPDRCTNKRFHISPPNHHPHILIGCLNLMNQTLEKNMCRLPEAVANSEVGDLKERIEQYIDPALQYACRSWHTHLADRHTPSGNTDEIASALHQFLERKFLFWLEVVSILGAVRNAVDALQAAVNWLEVRQDSVFCLPQVFLDLNQNPPTLDLANDCRRFVSTYFEIIHVSSPHIYHSALILAPKTSIVRKLYESHSQPFARIVYGVPESWDSNAAATTSPFSISKAVWSPCNRFIAITSYSTSRVDILDSTTLHRLQSLIPPWKRLACDPALAFSPDSRTLTRSGHSAHYCNHDQTTITAGGEVLAVTWDLQTGGVVSAIEWNGSDNVVSSEHPITYSMDGKMVAIHSYGRGYRTIISIFDVPSGVHIRSVDVGRLDSSCQSYIWTHGESVRFAAAKSTKITIWEVGFSLGAPAGKVETLLGPDHVNGGSTFEFLPAVYRVAFSPYRNALVWDARNSISLLDHSDDISYPLVTLSPDGHFCACSTSGSAICLWKESPTGYALHGKLSPGGKAPTPVFSPDGKSIIIYSGSTIQLWHMNSFTSTPSCTSVQLPQRTENFVLDFLPDRSSTVIARQKDSIVALIDLKSGSQKLTLETSMEVYGVRVIENTIAAIGHKKVITWNLPVGNPLPDVKLNIEDSTQTIHLRGGPSGKGRHRVIAASISPDFHHILLVTIAVTSGDLRLYCASTGQYLGYTDGYTKVGISWFAPGGDVICCAVGGRKADVWAFMGNSLVHKMVVDDIQHGSWGCPWGSGCGYQVTDDGWVLGLGGKRLLMLPPPWQSDVVDQVWNGQFLSLLHATLPEPVIIELEL